MSGPGTGLAERPRPEKRTTVIEAAGEAQPKRLRLLLREPSAVACVQDAQKVPSFQSNDRGRGKRMFEAANERAAVRSLVELREEWLATLSSEQLLPLAIELLALMKGARGLHLLEVAAELLKEARSFVHTCRLTQTTTI